MTQSQIVKTLAVKCQVSNTVSKGLLAALAQTAITEGKKNGLFVLPGLRRLVRVARKARLRRNRATRPGSKMAAKKVVKFRVAKAAREAIVPAKVKNAKP